MPGHNNPSHANNMRRFALNKSAMPAAPAPMARPAFTSAPAPMPAKMPMAAMKKAKGC